ncbi:hypothetical protein Q7P35_006638 [Cladosporium inversicolor]
MSFEGHFIRWILKVLVLMPDKETWEQNDQRESQVNSTKPVVRITTPVEIRLPDPALQAYSCFLHSGEWGAEDPSMLISYYDLEITQKALRSPFDVHVDEVTVKLERSAENIEDEPKVMFYISRGFVNVCSISSCNQEFNLCDVSLCQPASRFLWASSLWIP